MSASASVGEIANLIPLSSPASTEGEVAEGVTRWMVGNFRNEMADAVRATPFNIPLLCAIACREAGIYWLPLTPYRTPEQILALAVYDASGDAPNTSRGAFPTNTAQFRLTYGDTFTKLLIDETNNARAARGMGPQQWVYKGYGLFQYDLQAVRTDEAFFRNKLWYNFTACVSRAVGELKQKFAATGDLQDAVRAYNGSGPTAEQYARDVMRLLPFCEEAATGAATSAVPPLAMPPLARVDRATPSVRFPESSPPESSPTDPAAPANGEISDTADLDTARILANLGAPTATDAAPTAPVPGVPALLTFDLDAARRFLHACMTSHPRVTYGLGKKVPFHGAVPGRDFTQVDCSGFVREAVRLATNPPAPFPDGSVVQHDWVRARGFAISSIVDAAKDDGLVRIAFLRPQDAPSGIGHVVLISAGTTLESHGGVGPDSQRWTGLEWQAKAFVYVLARASAVSSPSLGASRQGSVGSTMGMTGGQPRGGHEVVVVTAAPTPTGDGLAAPAAPALAPGDVVRAARDAGLMLRPIFSRPASTTNPGAPAAPPHPELAAIEAEQSRFLSLQAGTRAEADQAAERLKVLPGVQSVYIKPAVEPPLAPTPLEAVTGSVPDFSANQGYLGASPAGIGARHAWSLPGGRGMGVRFADVEGGWTLDHLDLRGNSGGVLGGQPFTDSDWTNHGTAVLGVVRGNDNNFGVIGIAPDVNYAVVSHGGLGSASAIELAAAHLSAGDLMLLEMHRPGPRFNFASREDQLGYIAVEWWPDDFPAIRRAVLGGIIVVEAAGNGAEDLDSEIYDQPDPAFVGWQNPFRGAHDSGAILVGAGAPPSGQFGPDRSRLDFSNYGSRVDCQGWGREVVSTGYGDLFGGTDPTIAYTSQFSGTSSASPMVTGTLACLQGIARARGTPLNPTHARDLLRETGAPQIASGIGSLDQRIGNRPDLAALVERL